MSLKEQYEAKKEKYGISIKPTKTELSEALFERKKLKLKIKMNETLGRDLKVIVNEISAEDGSAESWILSGYCDDLPRWKDFIAWVRTDRDQGWVEITTNKILQY